MRDKRKYNKNNKQGQRRRRDREDEVKKFTNDEDAIEHRNGRNDISWYTRNPNLATAAAMVPFPYRPGMSFNIIAQSQYTIPGVMVLSWIPSVGFSNSATDPISIAAKEIYAKVRSKFSGSLEADAPDFIMYLMALDSIYAYLAYVKRIYRTINAYSPDNYQTPDALLVAMGVPQSAISVLRSQKVELWQTINTLVLSSRKFTCPALMDVMNRHYWMSDNVYLDADTMNAQFYLFNPKALYQYAEVAIPGDTEGNTAAGLEYVELSTLIGSLGWTAQGLLLVGEQLINKLVAWDDAYTISGYLTRAYEGAPLFMVEEIPLDEMLTPLYSEEVLMQIENSRVVLGSNDLDLNSVKVAQDPLTNVIKNTNSFEYATWTPAATDVGVIIENGNHIISQRSDQPTVADNIIATRLHVCNQILPGGTGAKATANIISGTEIPLYWSMISVEPSGTISSYMFDGIIFMSVGDTDLPKYAAFVSALSQFDWSPIVPLYFEDGGVPKLTLVGDVHNVTLVTPTVINNISRICLFSEFNAFDF